MAKLNILWLCVIGLAACDVQTNDAPEVESVEPPEVEIDVSTEIQIHGKNFHFTAVSNIESGEQTVAADFQVSLVPGSGGDPVELPNVQYVDSQLLRVIVPPGIAPGVYAVQVSGPHAAVAAIENAIKIYSDFDSDAVHDDLDPCVDADGDGLGRTDFDRSGCADSTVDSDDTDLNVCADTDADGCEDCSSGSWMPANDGVDADGDSFCAVNDCNDNNDKCDTDCTDSDGDAACVNHDCDDDPASGSSCDTGCATFFSDGDGDGFGSAGSPVEACVAPAGAVANSTDCADLAAADPACNGLPGASCNPGLVGSDGCDGADNDCDANTDEDHVATPTSCGVGACSGNVGNMACMAGVVSDTCDPLAGAAAADATCNNINDDCDAATDEDYVNTVSSCGVGACVGNVGTLSCSVGVESDSCDPLAGSSAENTATVGTCTDTVDNDCDGSTDGADLSCGSVSTPPVALFSVSPGAGDTATNFAGDANASFDLEDAFASLSIAWDWDGDGAFEKAGATSNHTFATTGVHRVTLRVTDSTALVDFRIFDLVVAGSGDLLTVTTGVDESDGGATPGSPGGTGFSLREALAFAGAQGTRQAILVPPGTVVAIGSALSVTGLTAGVDIVGDGATIDGSATALDCLEISNTTSIVVFGLAITNCPGAALSILAGSHSIERCELSTSLIGANVESNGNTIGPHNLVSSCATGIDLSGVSTVLENRVTGSTIDGVFLHAGSQGSLVQGNEFFRNEIGIRAQSTNNSNLHHNTIHDSATASIRLSNSVSSYGLLNNIFSTAPIGVDAKAGNFVTRESNDYFDLTVDCANCTLVASERTDDPLYIDDA
jgi:hypothetical protein